MSTSHHDVPATEGPQHTDPSTHGGATTKLFLIVWIWLLVLTGIEVFLAYLRLQPFLMLTVLVGLSLVKAVLIVAYFMHLRFERMGLVLTLIPATVFCIVVMLTMFFPDSVRLMNMRAH